MNIKIFVTLCLSLVLVVPAFAQQSTDKPIDVVLLTYNRGKTAACFASKFLDLAARKANLNVNRSLVKVPLESSNFNTYPMLIFSGDLRFKLSDKELSHLRTYIENGGFVLASAGCANEVWNTSFKKMVEILLPDSKFKPLGMDHPLFHTIYDLKQINPTKPGKTPVLYGIEVKGRLAMVYSPIGINDTAHAGGDCCCCGGEEILQSPLVNANILAYVLTH